MSTQVPLWEQRGQTLILRRWVRGNILTGWGRGIPAIMVVVRRLGLATTTAARATSTVAQRGVARVRAGKWKGGKKVREWRLHGPSVYLSPRKIAGAGCGTKSIRWTGCQGFTEPDLSTLRYKWPPRGGWPVAKVG